MKKHFRVLAILMILVLLISGCQKEADTTTGSSKETEGKKTVTVTSSFVYDMVRQISHDTVNIELIVEAGLDPHTYVAKPEDVKKINNADLVLYHGLHFEGKMIDILESNGIAITKDFDPADLIGEGAEVDPHFWFNLELYKQAINVVKEELAKLVPEEKDHYQKHYDSYVKELDELHEYIKEQMSAIPEGKRFLITPHDAFSYFANEYGIVVHAPQGVSTDSEVATQSIDETIDFIVENKVKALFAESTTDPARMEKLKEGVKAKGFDVKVVSGEGKELHSDSLEAFGKPLDTFIAMYKHNVDLIVENLK